MRTRKPPFPGTETRDQGAGAMCDAREGRWHVGYWAALVPNVLAIAGFYATRPGDTARHGRTNNVLLTKLNDYQLGGCTSL